MELPDTRQAVGLQFGVRQLIGHAGPLLLGPPHLAVDAEDVLNVMAVLVGDHVHLGEIPRRAESRLQFVVEARIDIDLPIARAVERPGGGVSETAGRRTAC